LLIFAFEKKKQIKKKIKKFKNLVDSFCCCFFSHDPLHFCCLNEITFLKKKKKEVLLKEKKMKENEHSL